MRVTQRKRGGKKLKRDQGWWCSEQKKKKIEGKNSAGSSVCIGLRREIIASRPEGVKSGDVFSCCFEVGMKGGFNPINGIMDESKIRLHLRSRTGVDKTVGLVAGILGTGDTAIIQVPKPNRPRRC